MQNNRVAIACQGGGSQTAFIAGVLKSFFDHDVHKKKRIVSFSGTSGGALCATLGWYSMIKDGHSDGASIGQRLLDFWKDNSTNNLFDQIINDSFVNFQRLMDGGWIPRWELSPSTPWVKNLRAWFKAFIPNTIFYDLKGLIEKHIDFTEIASWKNSSYPVLLIGAANVLSGEFKKFSSLRGEIQIEALLASAAVPEIFPAVFIGKDAYWDGLYSDNPPTDELLDAEYVGPDNLPDEIWIVQINPETRKSVPVTIQDIIDRRNEMIGNESLFQDLEKIKLINRFLEENAFTEEYRRKYRPIQIHKIEMSPELQEVLDYPTKLNRNHRFINRLIQDGINQGEAFLESLG